MDKRYKIEVSLSECGCPYPKVPFFWTLYCYETDWENVATGWAASPDGAWKAALQFYERYKR